MAAIKAPVGGRTSQSSVERAEDSCALVAKVSQLLKGGCRHRARDRAPADSPWDLELVLETRQHNPFKPQKIESVSLNLLALRTVSQVAVISARRVGEMHALSVDRVICRMMGE